MQFPPLKRSKPLILFWLILRLLLERGSVLQRPRSASIMDADLGCLVERRSNGIDLIRGDRRTRVGPS